jgi:hypothetical protein
MTNLGRLRRELFPDLKVLTGPFRGMKYPFARSHGSTLLPKLLGSYESELHPILEEMLQNKYTEIVDIGCAEGFYAVGLALRFADAAVHAFDTDATARRLCCELGMANGIEGRLRIGEFCDQSTLRSIPLGNKALIICDCEGYEGVLFTSAIIDCLVGHDLIVETHDFINGEISSRLRSVFASTHQVRCIKSIDDTDKLLTYQYRELDKYDVNTRSLVLAEKRPTTMEWLVMTPRT